jgi:membrane-associated phospholipid phosphatase
MSRDSAIKWSIIASMLLLGIMLVTRLGLTFPVEDFVRPVSVAMLLGAFGWFYHRNGTRNFVICLHGLAHVVIYTAIYTVVMYSLATTAPPLIDTQLLAADAAIGLHVPDIVAWTRSHPILHDWLFTAYNSLSIQTAFVVVLLGFTGDQRNLEDYVLQFMISTMIAVGIFAYAPAMGPCVEYDYAGTPAQMGYVQHLCELRSGERTVVTWRNAEGLITFPSFHTTWAILLAWSCRRRRYLNMLLWLLNGTVIFSTVALGWHYAVDVPGGILLAVIAISASGTLHRVRYTADGEPKPLLTSNQVIPDDHQ